MPVWAFFYLDFFAERFVGVCAGAKALYSRYNNSQQVYAINADNAVIKPANRPSENKANKMIAANNTMVNPRFFAKTAISFFIVFISSPLFWLISLYHKFELNKIKMTVFATVIQRS